MKNRNVFPILEGGRSKIKALTGPFIWQEPFSASKLSLDVTSSRREKGCASHAVGWKGK
jgi:hypothetical protein